MPIYNTCALVAEANTIVSLTPNIKLTCGAPCKDVEARKTTASAVGSMVLPESLLRKDLYHEVSPAGQYGQSCILLFVERTLEIEASLDPTRVLGVAEQTRLDAI